MLGNTTAFSRTGTTATADAASTSGHTLVGQNVRFLQAMHAMQCGVASGSVLLLHGEPGTGKKLVARAVHYQGLRRHRPFIPVHCAGLADAQSGNALRGLVRMAEGGTLFLDAVQALPSRGQQALLRVLRDDSDGQRSTCQPAQAAVRWIAASHTDLQAQAAAGRFDTELVDRLGTARIDLPPLRERLDDLPLLVTHLLGLAARETSGRTQRLTPQGLAWLAGHDWPGNVRELGQLLRRAHLACLGDEIGVAELRRATPPAHLPCSA